MKEDKEKNLLFRRTVMIKDDNNQQDEDGEEGCTDDCDDPRSVENNIGLLGCHCGVKLIMTRKMNL